MINFLSSIIDLTSPKSWVCQIWPHEVLRIQMEDYNVDTKHQKFLLKYTK